MIDGIILYGFERSNDYVSSEVLHVKWQLSLMGIFVRSPVFLFQAVHERITWSEVQGVSPLPQICIFLKVPELLLFGEK